MINDKLTPEDIDLLLDSLEYAKRNIREFQNPNDYERKQKKLAKIDEVTVKLRAMKKM